MLGRDPEKGALALSTPRWVSETYGEDTLRRRTLQATSLTETEVTGVELAYQLIPIRSGD